MFFTQYTLFGEKKCFYMAKKFYVEKFFHWKKLFHIEKYKSKCKKYISHLKNKFLYKNVCFINKITIFIKYIFTLQKNFDHKKYIC